MELQNLVTFPETTLMNHPLVQVGGIYYGYITNDWTVFTWSFLTLVSALTVFWGIIGTYEISVVIIEAIF